MIELPDIGPIWRERMADLGFTDEQIQGIEQWAEMEGIKLREARPESENCGDFWCEVCPDLIDGTLRHD